MKTTQEWFEQLPEDYRGKALKNMIDPTAEHYSLAGAISNGFVWNDTPEGKDYWNGVFREVMYGEKFETTLEIQPNESVIESGVIKVTSDKKTVEELINDPIEKVEIVAESSDEEKGGNTPDLLKKFKAQKSEIN
jgi:hypothetical protein